MQELIVEIIKLLAIVATPLILLFLVFRREIACIKAYSEDFKCEKCGHCCQFSILLNKQDIQNIISSGHSKEEFLEKKNFLNILKKDKSGFCVFLNKDKTCNIYEARPKTCRKFPYLNYLVFKGCDTRCPAVKRKC